MNRETRLSAQERARAIIQASEDMETAVHTETGRLVSEAARKMQDVLQKAISELAIISAAYSSGALPRKTPEREE